MHRATHIFFQTIFALVNKSKHIGLAGFRYLSFLLSQCTGLVIWLKAKMLKPVEILLTWKVTKIEQTTSD